MVSGHCEENIDFYDNFLKLVDVLGAVATHYDYPVIVSTHPRTQKRVDAMVAVFHGNIRLLQPLGFTDYNKLQVAFKAVLSGSSAINEDSPTIDLRKGSSRI